MAASNLAGRFNPAGNFIVAWNGNVDPRRNGWAIIDCTMNLPLLYWAYDQTGDPRYYHIATKHADTAIKAFIREDGSARHIVEFDPVTGDINRSYGGQGAMRRVLPGQEVRAGRCMALLFKFSSYKEGTLSGYCREGSRLLYFLHSRERLDSG